MLNAIVAPSRENTGLVSTSSTVLYWYGRTLSSAADTADHLRGRGMVESAVTDFRALEMVLHANLAEQFLREQRASAVIR